MPSKYLKKEGRTDETTENRTSTFNRSWEESSIGCRLGCFKNHLFLRFLFLFFILCTNIIKSSEKKFGSIWRSFDPPTRGSYFVWEIYGKCIGNFKKFKNLLFFLNFSPNFLLQSFFVMIMIYCNDDSKLFTHIQVVWHFWRGSFWSKMLKMDFSDHFDPPPSNMANNMNMGKMLWIVIVVYHDHDRKTIRVKKWG